jgi:hypothetical protein
MAKDEAVSNKSIMLYTVHPYTSSRARPRQLEDYLE